MARVGHADTKMKKLRKTIHDAVFELYECSEREVIPRFEKVLVYVLPKDRMSSSGLIHIPDAQQNKPVYEGIVVRTYEPQVRTILVQDPETKKMYPKEFIYDCSVKPGDHVLFRHYEGMPVSVFLDEKEFRIITEESINGILEYREKDAGREDIVKCLSELDFDVFCDDGSAASEMAIRLLEKFHIVRRTEKCRTLSGV